MVTCRATNCTATWPMPLEPNPDIASIGVCGLSLKVTLLLIAWQVVIRFMFSAYFTLVLVYNSLFLRLSKSSEPRLIVRSSNSRGRNPGTLNKDGLRRNGLKLLKQLLSFSVIRKFSLPLQFFSVHFCSSSAESQYTTGMWLLLYCGSLRLPISLHWRPYEAFSGSGPNWHLGAYFSWVPTLFCSWWQ